MIVFQLKKKQHLKLWYFHCFLISQIYYTRENKKNKTLTYTMFVYSWR